MNIIAATPADDDTLIDHYMAVWNSYGTAAADYRPDAREIVRSFIEIERRLGQYAAFLAFDGKLCAGSAICGLLRSPYPDVILTERRKRGYIWSVYVDPHFRRRGLARLLRSTPSIISAALAAPRCFCMLPMKALASIRNWASVRPMNCVWTYDVACTDCVRQPCPLSRCILSTSRCSQRSKETKK